MKRMGAVVLISLLWFQIMISSVRAQGEITCATQDFEIWGEGVVQTLTQYDRLVRRPIALETVAEIETMRRDLRALPLCQEFLEEMLFDMLNLRSDAMVLQLLEQDDTSDLLIGITDEMRSTVIGLIAELSLPSQIPDLPKEDDALVPGDSIVLEFTSGELSETGKQSVTIRVEQTGRYVLRFENANPPWSGYWVVWDYLSLQDSNAVIWEIGEEETPPDYTGRAFNEFCDPNIDDCTTSFEVGVTGYRDFAKEINDGELTEGQIEFTLTSEHIGRDLQLILSTLYSTHTDVDKFDMRFTFDRID